MPPIYWLILSIVLYFVVIVARNPNKCVKREYPRLLYLGKYPARVYVHMAVREDTRWHNMISDASVDSVA